MVNRDVHDKLVVTLATPTTVGTAVTQGDAAGTVVSYSPGSLVVAVSAGTFTTGALTIGGSTTPHVTLARRSGATTCQKCSAGKFQDVPGLETCQDCPIGYSQDEVGIPYCVKCSPGEFNDVVGATKCKPCAENTYSSKKGKTSSCKPCRIGESSVEGSAKCQKCDAGKYGDGCKNCPVGKFRASDDTQAAVCKNCPLGFIQINEASTLCIPLVCDAGSYQAKDNIGVCEPCSAGKFQNVKGQQQCETCASGTTPNADATACEPPPWGKCVVGEQYLHDEPANERDKWTCTACPEGMKCSGNFQGCPDQTTPCWSQMEHNAKYWTVPTTWTDNSKPFALCPFPAACNSTNCTSGSIGPLCAICASNFFRDPTGLCLPCTQAASKSLENVAGPIVFLLFFTILLVVKRKRVSELRRKYASTWRDLQRILTINISFMQVNSSLSIIVPVKWPLSYLNFMSNMDFVNFDVFGLFSLGCVDGVDYRARIVFACCVPLLVVAAVGVLHVCRKKVKQEDKRTRASAIMYLFDLVDSDKSENIDVAEFHLLLIQMKQPASDEADALRLMRQLGAKQESTIGGGSILTLKRDDLLMAASQNRVGEILGTEWVRVTENGRATSGNLASLLLLLFMIHAPVSQRLCHYFACQTVGVLPNGKSFLRADYNLECFQGDHMSFAPFVFLFLTFFTFLFPVVVLLILCKSRKRLYSPDVQRSYGFLYSRFTKGEFWALGDDGARFRVVDFFAFFRASGVLYSFVISFLSIVISTSADSSLFSLLLAVSLFTISHRRRNVGNS